MFKNGLVIFKTSKHIEKKKRKKHPADKKNEIISNEI